MIREIPDGLLLLSYECGAPWPVYLAGDVPSIGKPVDRQRLYYADQKSPVPGSAQLSVVHELGQQAAAERFAKLLRAEGYCDVTTCVNVQVRHELGEPVG